MMTTTNSSCLTAASSSAAPSPPSSPPSHSTITTSTTTIAGKELLVVVAAAEKPRRFRTPHPHDVLSGRGGGINAHVGNIAFRDWVKERRNAYTLAESKQQKARVAQEVIDIVYSQNPPGRFLQKCTSSKGDDADGEWWVALDKDKVMAKTSQALREGAPQIRAAHGKEKKSDKKKDMTSPSPSPKRKTSPKKKSPKTKAASSVLAPALQQPPTIMAAKPGIGGGKVVVHNKRKYSDLDSYNQSLAMQQPSSPSSYRTIAPRLKKSKTAATTSSISNEHELQAHVEQAVQAELQQHPQLLANPYATKKAATLGAFAPGQSFFPIDFDDEPTVEEKVAKKKHAHSMDDVTPPLTSADAAAQFKEMPVMKNLPPPGSMGLHRSHSLTLTEIISDWGNDEDIWYPNADPLDDGESLWSSSPSSQQQQQHPAQLDEQQTQQWMSMTATTATESSSSSDHRPRLGVHHDESSDTSATSALSANDLAGLQALAKSNDNYNTLVPPYLSTEAFYQA